MNEASRAQIFAADPKRNMWVSANAGSGKTRVLIDRVVRLMLAGSPPNHILCLTYTKAAASVMLQRLYKRLGSWAMLDDKRLHAELMTLGEQGRTLNTAQLAYARQLFAQALDTPGGLKVQTIHSFCEGILRRFPIEAKISPNFQVLDEGQANDLIQETLNTVAQAAPAVFKDFATLFAGGDLIAITRDLLARETRLRSAPDPADFNCDPDSDSAALRARILDGYETLLSGLAQVLERGSSTDQNIAKHLFMVDSVSASDGLKILEDTLLYKANATVPFGAKQSKIPTKKSQGILGLDDITFAQIRAQLDELAQRVQQARTQRIAMLEFKQAQILHNFACVFFDHYQTRKQVLGALTYDDLIARTDTLLARSKTAAWVLFRLDASIDHILVDEAQDTADAQWKIIQSLSSAIADNRAPDNRAKSLFVVGDKKQSIYSFQGANPDVFHAKRDILNQRFAPAQAPIDAGDLLYSFRSSKVILDLVDRCFAGIDPQEFQSDGHLAFHQDKPGRAELWPFLDAPKDQDEAAWYEPLNLPSAQNPKRQLAQQIAQRIDHLLRSNITVDGTRAIRAGDILILVQKRGRQFSEILRALKALNLPIAGADRIKLYENLAVRDVISCLRFAALPDDDLSLAEVLRSPILNLSEADLFTLAHDRSGTLWQSLRQNSDFTAPYDILKSIRARVDFDRPFELIEYILTTLNGRENLIARLGGETADALNELLAEAARFEQGHPPTLSGFLTWFDTTHTDVKRQLHQDADQIRLMTVHGAKGLEAPMVILADTGQQRAGSTPKFYEDDNRIYIAAPDADTSPELMRAKQQYKDDQYRERLRLLYVAMTRAESQLIICGAGARSNSGTDWYDLLAPQFVNADQIQDPIIGPIKQISMGDWPTIEQQGEQNAKSVQKTPDWLYDPVASPTANAPAIIPSKLPGTKTISGDAPASIDALIMGKAIHSLLEHLPHRQPDDRAIIARHLMSLTSLGDEMRDTVATQAMRIVSDPNFDWLFGANSLTEVPFSASYQGRTIKGTIDRLIITDQTITVVDFKNNQTCPSDEHDIPSGIMAQLGAYAIAIGQIYPDHQISLGILWTQSARFMPVSQDRAIDAFGGAVALDPARNDS